MVTGGVVRGERSMDGEGWGGEGERSMDGEGWGW